MCLLALGAIACGDASSSTERVGETAQASTVCEPVSPVLECVAQLSATSYEARFGYKNPNNTTTTIAVGNDNKFSPDPKNRGQTTKFLSGRQVDTFRVTFNGSNLVWTLNGKTATASKSSTRCPDSCNPATVTDNNPCTADSCSNGAPKFTLLPVGTACADADVCNGAETCDGAGKCNLGVPPPINDGNPCTTDSCDKTTGVVHTKVAAGTTCADGDLCNGAEMCTAQAACVAGTPPAVDDGNPCTTDSCQASLGVRHVALPSGSSCTDGNACNGAEACTASGSCAAGTAPVLSDGNPCTTDSCSPSTGPVHTPLAAGTSCSDGKACNGSESCSAAGQCQTGAPPVVNDGNPCTRDSCDPTAGVLHTAEVDGTSCTDADLCNGSETCHAGACAGGVAPVIDDHNPCTVDTCSPTAGVQHLALPKGSACGDANACNGAELCDAVGVCQPGAAPASDDGNSCTKDGCDPTTGVFHTALAAGTACSDANACNGEEQCNASGACVAGTPPALDDQNPCTVDTCDAASGVRHAAAVDGSSCADSDACNGAETCKAGACLPGAALIVDDGNPCTVDGCDRVAGVTHVAAPDGTLCADGNRCNGDELCGAGLCRSGTPPSVDDSNPCTLDACDSLQGVTHQPVPSGSSCSNGNACDGVETCSSSGSCVQGAAAQTDDSNPCTLDTCDAVLGVQHSAIPGTPCQDDLNACNGVELCDALANCVSTGAPPIDDGNACTADACDPQTGPQHVAIQVPDDGNRCTLARCDAHAGVVVENAPFGTSCADQDPCNGVEICNEGQCVATPVIGLDDGNPCTIDLCAGNGVVSHNLAPVDTPCSIAGFCGNSGRCDSSGACKGAVQGDLLDTGDPCIVGTCDPATGVVSEVAAPPGTPCDDGDACTTGDGCNAEGQCLGRSDVSGIDDHNPCTLDTCGSDGHTFLPAGAACGDRSFCDSNGSCVSNDNAVCDFLCLAQNTSPYASAERQRCTQQCIVDLTGLCAREGKAYADCWAPYQGQPVTEYGEKIDPYECRALANDLESCRTRCKAHRGEDSVTNYAGSANYSPGCVTFSCGSAPQTLQKQFAPAGTACEPVDECNGPAACDAAGRCRPTGPEDYSLKPCAGVGKDPPGYCYGHVCVSDPNQYNPCYDPDLDAPRPDGTSCQISLCSTTGVCKLGRCVATALGQGISCDDGNPCNGVNTCDKYWTCQQGTVINPSDGNPCTDDACSEGVVKHTPVTAGSSCSDGNACNGAEQCDAAATCHPGTTLPLDDGNPCTSDSCDPAGGARHTPVAAGTACDNTTLCDGRETCDAGGVCRAGNAVNTDDGNPCTIDSCDPILGVLHAVVAALTACDDATVCNGREVCSASGQCQAGTPLALDDGNPCTADTCDAALGVGHAQLAAGTACSDGNECNGLEQCAANGACQAGSSPNLDDGNPCTIDSCSAASGIKHAASPTGTSCSDGDACNGNEACNAAGACVNTPLSVDDGNPCTADSCDSLSGVRHIPIDTPQCAGLAGWSRLLSSQPSPRDGAAGVFIGTGELLVFGGNNAGAVLGDAWLWSPTTRAWRRAAAGPDARAGASLSYDSQRGRAVLFGGVSSAAVSANYFNDVWEYDASADTWTRRNVTGSAPAARAFGAFAFDGARGRAVLFGGTSDSAFGDTWEWDAAGGRWSQLGSSGPAPRYGAAFAFDPNARRYALFGGSPSNATGALVDTWTLSADTGQWQQQGGAGSPPGRAGASMTFDPTAGHLVLFGGTGIASANLDDTWELDGQTGAWSVVATSFSPPATTGAVLGFDPQAGRTVVASGITYSSSGRFTPQSSSVWSLDRVAARWTERSSEIAPPLLRRGAAFDSTRQKIVALGTAPPPSRSLMWDFDPRSYEWSARDIADVNAPFNFGVFREPANGTNSLVYSATRDRVFQLKSKYLAAWDGQAWAQRCAFAPDSPVWDLSNPAVAFDGGLQKILISGGVHGLTLGQPLSYEVYSVDLDTCATQHLTVGFAHPAARVDAVASWDSDRQRLNLFGGSAPDQFGRLTYQGDTWELDPAAQIWTPITGTGPAARGDATSVYDPTRRRLILYGGRDDLGARYDTWELDPAAKSWKQLSTAGPSQGEDAALTFDEARKAPALVSTAGAVWHLMAGAWVADLNPTTPSARSGFSGGWGPASQLAVLFGGTSGDGQRDFLGDLWIWRDGWRGVYPGSSGSSLSAYGQGSPSTRAGYSVPAGRTGHVLATGFVDARGTSPKDVAVLFGGEGASDQFLGLFGDTWTLDLTTLQWTQLKPSTPPRARTGHAMSPFPTRGYLLFGGLGRDRFRTNSSVDELRDTFFSDTWVWELGTLGWRQLAADGPSARYGHAMATDEVTNEVILFGGRDASGVSGETWRLNLSNSSITAVWQKLSPPTSPLPRFGHSMSWDPVRHRIVLSGGEGAGAGQSFADTWEWDSPGQRWVLRNIQPLEGRAGHASFYDRKRSQLIAFGGFSHRDNGQFALTYGDTLAFLRAENADPTSGFLNGTRCTTGTECGSGLCTDGFCCNSTCTGQCAACDVAGAQGTCTPVVGAPHAGRTACGSSGGECAVQCNGVDATKCNAPPAGTPCGPDAGCSGDSTMIASKGSCDATGACVSPEISCGGYICCDAARCSGPHVCLTDCQGQDKACAIGYKCIPAGHRCYKPTKIISLTSTPAVAKVGVPMTINVSASEPNTTFDYRYSYSSAPDDIFPMDCSGSSCSWTPAIADAGKTVTWEVTVGVTGTSYSDDTKTLTLTVQP